MLRKLFGISKCIVAGHTETHTMVAKVTPWTWPTGRLLRGVDNIYTHIGLRCCVLGVRIYRLYRLFLLLHLKY